MKGAPKGNQYWRLRTKHGRDKIFETPEDMAEKANEYFEWCGDNPLYEIDFIGSKDGPYQVKKPKMRPFTLHGLCNFLDISMDAFSLYEKRKDFVGITTRIRQIVYNQKFEGAACGFLNHNIIARDLGLKDHKEIDLGEKKKVSKLFPTEEELNGEEDS